MKHLKLHKQMTQLNPPTNQKPEPLINTPGNPPPDIVIGTAIKTDGDDDNDTQEVKIEKKDLNIQAVWNKEKI